MKTQTAARVFVETHSRYLSSDFPSAIAGMSHCSLEESRDIAQAVIAHILELGDALPRIRSWSGFLRNHARSQIKRLRERAAVRAAQRIDEVHEDGTQAAAELADARDDSDPLRAAIKHEEARIVSTALRVLPLEQRSVIGGLVNGESLNEVACRLAAHRHRRVLPNTVSQIGVRARASLRPVLACCA